MFKKSRKNAVVNIHKADFSEKLIWRGHAFFPVSKSTLTTDGKCCNGRLESNPSEYHNTTFRKHYIYTVRLFKSAQYKLHHFLDLKYFFFIDGHWQKKKKNDEIDFLIQNTLHWVTDYVVNTYCPGVHQNPLAFTLQMQYDHVLWLPLKMVWVICLDKTCI